MTKASGESPKPQMTSNPTLRRQIMRTQNLQHLAAVITDWFTNPPAEL